MSKSIELHHILRELEAIKRLLVAGLAKEGVTQEQLAAVLQTSQPSVSRMFPGGLPKPNGEVRPTKKRNAR